MSELITRIQRVTSDLHTIQSILDHAARPETAKDERNLVMDELLDTDLINGFKSSVDHMRHLLWSYIEAASSEKRQDISYKLQAVRMQRVTEMLHVLKPTLEQSGSSLAPEARSFLDMVQSITKTAAEVHSRNKVV